MSAASYSKLDRLLHSLAFSSGPALTVLAEMEDRLFARDLPPVSAVYPELCRLCEFLIRNAAAVSIGREVVVRTGATSGSVLFQVDDAGPPVSAAALGQLFEPAAEERPGTSRLELAACKSLAKRLGARLEAEPGSAGGVAVTVELPVPS